MLELDDLHKLDGNRANEQVRTVVRKLELAEAMYVSWVAAILGLLHVC
jgi:hypothetical protein